MSSSAKLCTEAFRQLMPPSAGVQIAPRLSGVRRRLFYMAQFASQEISAMRNVQPFLQPASRELIVRLIKAGYLPPALCDDADAVTAAIARLKQDLRNGGNDEGPAAA